MEDALQALSQRMTALERRANQDFTTLKDLERVIGLLETQREAAQLVEQRVLELSTQVGVQELLIGHLAAQVPDIDAVMAAVLEDQDRFLDAKSHVSRQLLAKEVERWHVHLLAVKHRRRT